MQIMVTSIFQVNGINLLILVGLRRSNTQMEVPITLSPWTALRGEKAKVPADIEFNAEFLAKKLAVMWQDNQDVGKMTGARTKVSGRDAYQLQIVMKSGQYLITWIFQKGEKVYTISFEGDAETLKTFIPYIENTWSLDGTGAVTDWWRGSLT